VKTGGALQKLVSGFTSRAALALYKRRLVQESEVALEKIMNTVRPEGSAILSRKRLRELLAQLPSRPMRT